VELGRYGVDLLGMVTVLLTHQSGIWSLRWIEVELGRYGVDLLGMVTVLLTHQSHHGKLKELH
jgi:hypothetical protein